jgi:hypothetical protein
MLTLHLEGSARPTMVYPKPDYVRYRAAATSASRQGAAGLPKDRPHRPFHLPSVSGAWRRDSRGCAAAGAW